MLNAIIVGISQKIYETFGENYTIYSENVEQKLKKPCFLIVNSLNTNTKLLPPRYFRSYNFHIHYFPESDRNARKEINEVSEKLKVALEYINVIDNSVRGIKMTDEIVDDVLHFNVSYDLFVELESESINRMQTLTLEGNING